MNTPFFTKVLLILKDYCDKEHGGNMRAASRALGLDPETGVLFRWLQCLKENPKNKRAPNLETVGPCMDHIGVLLLAPEEVPNIEGRLDKRFPHEKRRRWKTTNIFPERSKPTCLLTTVT